MVPLISTLVCRVRDGTGRGGSGGHRAARSAASRHRSERDSLQVVDVVSADDIGKLPDHNTAAALRRIPGVSVMEDQSEPRVPVLRGPELDLQSHHRRRRGARRDRERRAHSAVGHRALGHGGPCRGRQDRAARAGRQRHRRHHQHRHAQRVRFAGAVPQFAGGARRRARTRATSATTRRTIARRWLGGTTFGADEQFGIVRRLAAEQIDIDIPQFESATPSVREYTAAGAPVDSGSHGQRHPGAVPAPPVLVQQHQDSRRRELKLDWRPSDTFRAELCHGMEDDGASRPTRWHQVPHRGRPATSIRTIR